MRIIQLLYDEVSRREFSNSRCFQNTLLQQRSIALLFCKIEFRTSEKACRRKKNDLHDFRMQEARNENVIRLYSYIRK